VERFPNNNDLHTFITGVNWEMATEYERIRRRALEDPGTAGDQGEENWATLLREWLPPYLQIVTKGRILNAQGEAGPQVDVLVLSPAYPKRLLDKKLYLAGGVEAAFECKITLEARHIEKAVENAAKIRRLLPKRTGTPYKELNSPIIYGLLAHSHSWKGAASTPVDNVTDNLWESDRNHAAHPREMLDLLCVADLAAWAVRKVTGEGLLPGQKPGHLTTEEPYAETTLIWSAPQVDPPFSRDVLDFHRIEGQTPIGSMLTDLLARLAWRHPSLEDLATFFIGAQLRGPGAGYVRQWPYDEIYSTEVRKRVGRKQLNVDPWSEWGWMFPTLLGEFQTTRYR
jgi:hypothetical protein